jgi:hypothetical protein
MDFLHLYGDSYGTQLQMYEYTFLVGKTCSYINTDLLLPLGIAIESPKI